MPSEGAWRPATAALIPAAGLGLRMGGGTPKALRMLAGRSLLEHAVENLARSVDLIVVAAPAEHLESVAEMTAGVVGETAHVVVPGGATRQASVAKALAAVPDHFEVVLVHDAARPLIPDDVVHRVIDAVSDGADAVVPVLPVVDTIKQVNRSGQVVATPDRSALRAVQTPQGFAAEVLRDAHRRSTSEATDDAGLAEAAGYRVDTVPGDERAFKITTGQDLEAARRIMEPAARPADLQIGTGIDVHAVGDQPPMALAGLLWPGEPALVGHSDGDAVCHAAADAMLSAAGVGDLGSVFGTDRPEWAGASGTAILTEAVRLITQAGWQVSNMAITVVGNRPKIMPRRREAQDQLGAIVAAPVHLTATTTDGLGLTGRGEGVAATATVLLSRSTS